jgi:uncharacterized phage protein gp47/JayE
MSTFPLPTLAGQITATGISAPPYSDILQSLIASMQGIYGSDIYLEPDSQDGQALAIFGKAINDCNALCIAVFNNRSPATAQGAGLSSIVKINGIARNVASNSTVSVLIVGQIGTPINNGLVVDSFGNQWALPALVVIPTSGQIVVTATATSPGAITAQAGTIVKIGTPTFGWQTVTNPAAAVPGAPVETDAQLRARQSTAAAGAGMSSKAAILAAINEIPDVQGCVVNVNDTGETNALGIPAHSIAVVVEGGDVQAVAAAIALKKNPGTGTYGTTTEVVIDPQGMPNPINLFQTTEIAVSVLINVNPLTGYASSTAAYVGQAIAGFVNSLPDGQQCYMSWLWAPASLSGDVAVAAIAEAAVENDLPAPSQAQLDVLRATYTIASMQQSRADMVTTGAYAAGQSTFQLGNVASFQVGQPFTTTLDNGALLTGYVTGIFENTISVSTPVPAGRTLAAGSQIFINGDLVFSFFEQAQGSADNVTVNPL